jgi:rubrerythrin
MVQDLSVQHPAYEVYLMVASTKENELSAWVLSDINWSELDLKSVTPDLLAAVKTAALVEANSRDYVTYLHNIFPDDSEFRKLADIWGEEEVQHGNALGHWAELVDPAFDFSSRVEHFRSLYQLPLNVSESVRGTNEGELIARCVVEAGTCSYYSAIRDFTEEPVLKQICTYIARDEPRHYRLFKSNGFKRTSLGFFQRLKIAIGRVVEVNDDELGYAWHAANSPLNAIGVGYDREKCTRAYNRIVAGMYERKHMDAAVHMVASAIGLGTQSHFMRIFKNIAWWKLKRYAQP